MPTMAAVPADATVACGSALESTACAMGLRQMFPMQTVRMCFMRAFS
jgi:hypothetical protein